MPDLTRSLAEATHEVQRQVFEAFDLQIAYDKVRRRIEISATASEAVAQAFENTKALQKEGSVVVAKDIAGVGLLQKSPTAYRLSSSQILGTLSLRTDQLVLANLLWSSLLAVIHWVAPSPNG